MPPSTPPRKQLTRDQRLQVITLHQIAGYTYDDIAFQLHCTSRQAQNACQNPEHPTPKKGRSRHPKLNPEQADDLVEFICRSFSNRILSYAQLAEGPFSYLKVSEYAIQSAL